ncbi:MULTISPECIES: transposase [unclassified Streptomyces]|uniref:transposase n=1 Tax=unclassified Streptomyces TaxID=2593676 RepID=UPI001F085C4E|nr:MULTISPECIES: transposase [unclassified Streptomyces]
MSDCAARRPSPRCCGASPVEKSSGKSRRRRLNRGGDRQANAALHRSRPQKPETDLSPRFRAHHTSCADTP